MEGLEIRNYRIEDIERYYELYKNTLATYSWEVLDTVDEIKRSIFSTPFHIDQNHILAFHKGKMVGSAWAMLNPAYRERHGPYPYINIMVDPTYQKKGIGSELLKHLVESYHKNNVQGLDAFIDQRKIASSNFLQKNGFKKKGAGFVRMEHDLKGLKELPLPVEFSIRNPDFPGCLDPVVENMNDCCSTLEDHKPYSREFIGTRPYIVDPNNHPGNFLLEKDGELIGTVFSTLESTHKDGRRVIMGGVFALGTLQEYRRQGLGQFLLSKSMGWIKNMGAEKCYLYLSATNTSAMRLYLDAGFVETERGYKYRLEFQ